MASRLETLERELARLDALLAQDAGWRALQRIDARIAAGEWSEEAHPDAVRTRLETDLAHNPHFGERGRVAAEIRQLRAHSADRSGTSRTERIMRVPRLSERIALIEPRLSGEAFRTRLNIKPQVNAPEAAGADREPTPIMAPVSQPPVSRVGLPPTDDLCRIRGLDGETAAKLAALGITRFATIATWTAADVRFLKASLGLGRRIARQGWIEQAAILATGRETAFATWGAAVDIAVPPRGEGADAIVASPIMSVQERPDASALASDPAPIAPIGEQCFAGAPEPVPPKPQPSGPSIASGPASPQVVSSAGAGARTRALFERGRWLDSIRSLETAVLAAEAAARRQRDASGRLPEPARGLPEPPAMPPLPLVPPTRPAPGVAPSPSVPQRRSEPADGSARRADFATLDPAPPSILAHVEPPPPPTPYREPVTEFGRSPHTETDLGDIVSDLRKALCRAEGDVRSEAGDVPATTPARKRAEWGEDESADLPGIHAEEASVEIKPRAASGPPAEPPCGAPLQPLPVRVRPPLGEGQRVELLEGEAHEAYRGMPMEASVEIVQFDEEGRRIPKAAKSP